MKDVQFITNHVHAVKVRAAFAVPCSDVSTDVVNSGIIALAAVRPMRILTADSLATKCASVVSSLIDLQVQYRAVFTARQHLCYSQCLAVITEHS